jgi:hypothetical protein
MGLASRNGMARQWEWIRGGAWCTCLCAAHEGSDRGTRARPNGHGEGTPLLGLSDGQGCGASPQSMMGCVAMRQWTAGSILQADNGMEGWVVVVTHHCGQIGKEGG